MQYLYFMRKYRIPLLFSAMCLFILLLLTACQSTTDSKIPSWIKETVFLDSDLKWAYENGYFWEEPVVLQEDNIKLTIWGALADPVRTQVIYSIEGEKADQYWAYITSINGKEISQKDNANLFEVHSQQGKVASVFIDAPPENKQELTIGLKPNTNTGEATIKLDKHSLLRYYNDYDLDYIVSLDNAEIKIERVVYTPTKVIVFFDKNNADIIEDTAFPQLFPHLINTDNVKSISQGTHLDRGSTFYRMFKWTDKTSDLKLVIPAILQSKNTVIAFSQDDVGKEKEVLGTTIRLEGWRISNNTLELDILFNNEGSLYEIEAWEIIDQNGNVKRANAHSFDHRIDPNSNNKEFLRTYTIQGSLPEKVRATVVSVIKTGDWEFSLPDIEDKKSQEEN